MKILPYKVVVPDSTAYNGRDLREWCYEQFGPDESGLNWHVCSDLIPHIDRLYSEFIYKMSFADESAAMLCKLRWL